MPGLWNILLAAGLVLGLYLAVMLLVQNHANRLAARLLAIGVSLVAIAIFAELVQAGLAPRPALFLICLNINVELAFGPLIFLLVRSVLFPERGWQRRDVVHFVPITTGCLFWFVLWMRVDDPSAVLESGLDSVFPLIPFLSFKALVLFGYLGAALSLLQDTLESGRRYVQGKRRLDLRQLRAWLLALSIIPLVIYVTAFAELLGVTFTMGSDTVSGVLLTGLVFAILTLLLARPWLLSINARQARPETLTAEARQLLRRLEADRPWLDPDLDLAQLAALMEWPENHLSRVINEDLGSNFYALLARYRLAQFETLARDPDARDRSVLDLAMDAGFNSKASFYRAFRQRHGATTPAAFREGAQVSS